MSGGGVGAERRRQPQPERSSRPATRAARQGRQGGGATRTQKMKMWIWCSDVTEMSGALPSPHPPASSMPSHSSFSRPCAAIASSLLLACGRGWAGGRGRGQKAAQRSAGASRSMAVVAATACRQAAPAPNVRRRCLQFPRRAPPHQAQVVAVAGAGVVGGPLCEQVVKGGVGHGARGVGAVAVAVAGAAVAVGLEAGADGGGVLDAAVAALHVGDEAPQLHGGRVIVDWARWGGRGRSEAEQWCQGWTAHPSALRPVQPAAAAAAAPRSRDATAGCSLHRCCWPACHQLCVICVRKLQATHTATRKHSPQMLAMGPCSTVSSSAMKPTSCAGKAGRQGMRECSKGGRHQASADLRQAAAAHVARVPPQRPSSRSTAPTHRQLRHEIRDCRRQPIPLPLAQVLHQPVGALQGRGEMNAACEAGGTK